MDPNATLKMLRDHAAYVLRHADTQTDEAIELAESIEALHGWIRRGGFLPDAWRNVVADALVAALRYLVAAQSQPFDHADRRASITQARAVLELAEVAP